MATVYIKQTFPNGDVWFTSSMLVKATPEKQIAYIQKLAKNRGIECKYELATQEEYRAYYSKQK